MCEAYIQEDRLNQVYTYVRVSDGAQFKIKFYSFWTELTNGDSVKFAYTDQGHEMYVSASQGHLYKKVRIA